jgi:hypothetical protein
MQIKCISRDKVVLSVEKALILFWGGGNMSRKRVLIEGNVFGKKL